MDLYAYPYGDTDCRVMTAVEAAGFRAAFVEERRPMLLPHLAIPRVGIYSAERWYLAGKLSGLWEHPLPGPLLASGA